MEDRMKAIAGPMGVNRRALLSAPALLSIPALLRVTSALAQDPISQLPSWNDGPAKQAIIDFVRATTDRADAKFVPLEERIATFDQDGTLWVEHPMYTQVLYCLERVPAVVAQKPELKEREPFKTVLSGNREARPSCRCMILRKFSSRRSPACQSRCSKVKQRNGLKLPSTRAGSASIPSSYTNLPTDA
jgi:hypothetical protein